MPISLFGGIRPLAKRQALRDALAGVNLASINIPQVLGYSRIAGMPVVTGLYTVMLPSVAFAIFGSSRHLVVAADSATAAIFSSSVSRMAVPASAHYAALVGIVALLTAALLLAARIFKLGFLADFLSRTVVAGFLAGVGVQVAISMLGDMSGLAPASHNSLVRLWQLGTALAQISVPTLLLSAVVAAVILAGNRFAPRWPLSLIAVVSTIAAGAYLHFAARGIAVIGAIPGGLPSLGLPHVTWPELLALLPVAGSCFVIVIAQSAATSRGFALPNHESVDSDADILGLSAANAAAALSGAFVVNGSPTQTAIAARAGASSQVAQLVLACVALAVLMLASGPLQYLPRCVLAAIVFTIAIGMIDVKSLRAIRRESPGEFSLALATTVTVVAIGVEQGILLAMALSLFRHVRHSYRPHTMMFAPGPVGGPWVLVPAAPGRMTAPGVIAYRFGADLFYANQNRFVDEVRALVKFAPSPVRWLIIDADAVTDVDYSAARALRDLFADLHGRGVGVIFGRVNIYLRADMDRHGLTESVGESHIFPTLHEAIAQAMPSAPASGG